MRDFSAAVAIAAGLAGILGAGYVPQDAAAPQGVYCPTEDSCAYSYAHHTGTVARVTP